MEKLTKKLEKAIAQEKWSEVNQILDEIIKYQDKSLKWVQRTSAEFTGYIAELRA